MQSMGCGEELKGLFLSEDEKVLWTYDRRPQKYERADWEEELDIFEHKPRGCDTADVETGLTTGCKYPGPDRASTG